MTWVLLILMAIFLVARMSEGRSGPSGTSDDLIQRTAEYFSIEPELMKAIIQKESGFRERAYNPETFSPPEGKAAFRGEIPDGADITGYQGSFGLGQIYHSEKFSLARKMRMGGDYPEELLHPAVNLEIMGRFLKQLVAKGFGVETIDVYNVGETEYAKGARNPSYQRDVEANYVRMKGVV